MSKLYKTHFDDELLNVTNDKYALKLLSFQLYEALMNLEYAILDVMQEKVMMKIIIHCSIIS